LNKYIEELEGFLGLEKGFFSKLQTEDDWSFIVKLHSLIEATCTSLLTEELGRKEIFDAFSQVQVGTPKSGKLAFIKALDLLPAEHIKFIETLGWVRNRFVHNISNHQSTLSEFIQSLGKQRKKECIKYLKMNFSSTAFKGNEISGDEYMVKEPNIVIIVSSMQVLEFIRMRIAGGIKRQEFIKEKIDEHLEEHGPFILRQDEVSLPDITAMDLLENE